VQRLAEVTNVFGSAGVLVEQASARSKIEKNSACKHCNRAAREWSSEYGFARSHEALSSLTLLTTDPASWLQNAGYWPNGLLDPATIPA
jgi:hypothetical protein